MSGSGKRKAQRDNLIKRQKGLCYFCGVEMTPVHTPKRGVRPDPTSATFEHMDDRYSDERGKHKGEFRNVASCWQCNWERSRKATAELPKEELWKRSGRSPRHLAQPDRATNF